jgi:hypothetical protein
MNTSWSKLSDFIDFMLHTNYVDAISFYGAAAVVFGTIVNVYFLLQRVRNIVQPYNVAVIGLPRSGKTTLITSMFQVIFFQRFFANRLVPRGSETIDRVNKNLETIQLGRALGPTAEQDLFAYRVDKRVSIGLFKRTYRIAIGDFAGEYSDKLADEKNYKAIYETTFFRWVMEADAYIFVLDMAAYLRDQQNYIARVGSEFRAAWQRLVDYHLEGEKNIRNKKIAVVINKCDVIARNMDYKASDNKASDNLVWQLGFSNDVPSLIRVSPMTRDIIEHEASSAFATVIEFFENQSRAVKVIAASSFALSDNLPPREDAPLGVRSLIEFIMP